MKVTDGTHVKDQVNENNVIVCQLNFIQISYYDEIMALIILSSSLECWNAIVMVVRISCRNQKMKW